MQVGKQMSFPGTNKSDGKLIGAKKMAGDALCEQTHTPLPGELG